METKRPIGLTILCILTIINAGLSVLSNVSSLISGPDREMLENSNQILMEEAKKYEELGVDDVPILIRKLVHMYEQFFESFYTYHFIVLVIFSIGLAGAWLMFRRYILGFHLYIVYSILSVAHIYLFVNPNEVPTIYVIMTAIVSAIFIGIYARFRKWMILESFIKN